MDRQSIINIIELVAILVAATFGVLGSVTRTKDSNGKLTRWGIVAVVGILLTNSFSFVNNYLKQQNAAEAKIASQEEKIKEQDERIKKYKEQQEFQKTVVVKADSSLTAQMKIQGTIGNLLESFRTSLYTQNNILSTNQTIARDMGTNLESQKFFSKNQDSLLRDFNREMYRLNNAFVSFKISYDCFHDRFKDFTQQVMDSSKASILRNHDYLTQTGFYHNKLGLSGGYRIENGEIKIVSIYVRENSPLIPNAPYTDQFNEFILDICFAGNDIRNSIYLSRDSDLIFSARSWNEKNGFVPANIDNYYTYAGRTQVNYEIFPQEKRISFFVQTTRVNKTDDDSKIRSLLDLPGKNVKICFFGDGLLGKTMKLEWLRMGFGENSTMQLRFNSEDLERISPESPFFYYKIKKENIL